MSICLTSHLNIRWKQYANSPVREVVLVGNIPPRDVMAAGTPGQVREAVKKAMGGISDHNRILWSVGGGMPPGVKDENIIAFMDAVREFSK